MTGTPAGTWITFEGVEGAGKSTQIQRLQHRLETHGLVPLLTREPGGTELGRRLRAILLEPTPSPMEPLTELLLYTADRAQHLAEAILPALDRGQIVLCDRFVDATLAYQGYGRELGTEMILELHRRAPLDRRPDRTILLDVDPADGVARARDRDAGSGLDRTEGRFEAEELAFHQRVRTGYLELAAADPARFRVVDGRENAKRVERSVREALRDLLPALGD